MEKDKRQRLKRSGWKVGCAAEFLGLSPAEAEYVELKLALARGLRARREESGLTQEEVALGMGSSQSRVAKMEAADGSVTVDLLIRALLSLGASRSEVARLVRENAPQVPNGARRTSRAPSRGGSNGQDGTP